MITDVALRRIKPAEKPYKVFDSGGLFLIVNPNGSRWWRLRYQLDGKERGLSLGTYPEVSLKEARDKRNRARGLLAEGRDPSTERKAEKLANGISFEPRMVPPTANPSEPSYDGEDPVDA